MNSDLWIGFFKISSMLATGLFAALGLVTKYKDESGKFTKWGKLALLGIVFSSAASLGLYTLETSNAKAKAVKEQREAEAVKNSLGSILNTAQATVAQTNTLKQGLDTTSQNLQKNLQTTQGVQDDMKDSLRSQSTLLTQNARTLDTANQIAMRSNEMSFQISRMQYPMSELTLQVILEISTNHPLFAKNKDSFESQARAIIDDFKTSRLTNYDDGNVAMAMNGQSFRLFRGTRLLPESNEVRRLITYTSLEFSFFKSKSDAEANREPSLFFFYAPNVFNQSTVQTENTGALSYSVANNSFLLLGERQRVKLLGPSVGVFSLLDLVNANLMITNDGVINQGFTVDEIVFSNSVGQRVVIPGEKLRPILLQGRPVLTYDFPKDWKDLFTEKSRFLL